MAILKGQRGKTFLSVLVALVVLAGAVPLVSAYEAYTIDVKAYLKEEPFIITKFARLATDEEAALAGNPTNPPGISWNDVPVFTRITWVVTIAISNPYDYVMTDVIVKDNFSAELNGELISDVPLETLIKRYTKGKAPMKTIEPQQIRIEWEVGTLAPGESATLELLVWTKFNPAGKQEYTSTGWYTMNSGPTMKWLDNFGHQWSAEAPSLTIHAH